MSPAHLSSFVWDLNSVPSEEVFSVDCFCLDSFPSQLFSLNHTKVSSQTRTALFFLWDPLISDLISVFISLLLPTNLLYYYQGKDREN